MAVLLSAILHGRESSHAGFCRTTFHGARSTGGTVNRAYELATIGLLWKESPAIRAAESCFFTF